MQWEGNGVSAVSKFDDHFMVAVGGQHNGQWLVQVLTCEGRHLIRKWYVNADNIDEAKKYAEKRVLSWTERMARRAKEELE